MSYGIPAIQRIWIGEVFLRYPNDLREFHTTDLRTPRGVRLLVWAVTVYFCIAALFFIRLLARPLLDQVRE